MPRIRLEHITKQFSKGSRAVDQLDLVIEDGDFVSLLGPSGCGKTQWERQPHCLPYK